MRYLNLGIFSAALALLALSVSATPAARVFGGTNAAAKEYPYQVSLQRDSRHGCGAAIISPEWLLTAAHCSRAAHEAVAGTINIKDGAVSEQRRTIVKFIQHSQFWSERVGPYDIALVRVSEPFTFNEFVKPIELPAKGAAAAAGQATITGWGATFSPQQTFMLQKGNISILALDVCRNQWPRAEILESNLCAGGSGTGVCSGDSGGPLVQQSTAGVPVLVGLVSYGSFSCSDTPAVFTSVSHYVDWIAETMQKANE